MTTAPKLEPADIVERIRHFPVGPADMMEMMREAADEIERLRAAPSAGLREDNVLTPRDDGAVLSNMNRGELLELVARAIATADERNGGAPYEYRITLGKHTKEMLFDEAEAALAAIEKALTLGIRSAPMTALHQKHKHRKG